MALELKLESDSIDQTRARIDALKADVAQLQTMANAATESVKRAGATTRQEVTSLGQTGATRHHGGFGMHAAHQLHSIGSLLQGNINLHTLRSAVGLTSHLGGAVGAGAQSLLTAVAPYMGPIVVATMIGREAIQAFAERTKIKQEASSAQLRTANFAWDAQYEAEKAGTGDDFFGLRRDAAAFGRQRNTAKMSFLEKEMTFQTTIDTMGDKAGAEYATRVMERMKKAQKLFGGSIQDLDKHYGRYAADERFSDREVNTAFALKKAEADAFLLHPLNWIRDAVFRDSARRQNFELRRDISDDVIDKEIAREEERRKRIRVELETEDPSWRAIQKQSLEYFRIVEENTHSERMEWSPV